MLTDRAAARALPRLAVASVDFIRYVGRTMPFGNVYDDSERARAYATLEFPGTYYLAYRDLPAIVAQYVTGLRALDFGCGAGRSTRFLKRLGFNTIGIDISGSMIALASEADPNGKYQLIQDGDFSALELSRFNLILSAFAFRQYSRCGQESPDFLAVNSNARSGDAVGIVMKDVADARPVVDFVWSDDDYARLFAASGLDVIARYKPLGCADEHHQWLTETSIAPWVIYVLARI